jgi:hypothetical protein
MKTLSDFKKRLSPGVKLATEHAKLGELGIREIERVQSNAFTLLTDKNGEMVESWCYFPKASDFEVLNKDTVLIYWGSGVHKELILTYRFV